MSAAKRLGSYYLFILDMMYWTLMGFIFTCIYGVTEMFYCRI